MARVFEPAFFDTIYMLIESIKRIEMPELAYTPEVAASTAPLYAKVKHVVPEIEWPVFAPTIAAINALKREKRAVILAHNYIDRKSTRLNSSHVESSYA